MTTPIFTAEQVEGAIRYGMRGDRMRYEIGPVEGAQKSAAYGSNRTHYRSVAQKCLTDGDYRQAAEKCWGAYAQTIKSASAGYGIRVSTHSNILSVAQSLNSLALGADADTGEQLRRALHTARSLHQHCDENDLLDDEVIRSVAEVMDAVDLLAALFYRS